MHVKAEGKVRLAILLENFPRLVRVTPESRDNWQMAGAGQGIYWPELDEEIYVPAHYEGRIKDETNERNWRVLH